MKKYVMVKSGGLMYFYRPEPEIMKRLIVSDDNSNITKLDRMCLADFVVDPELNKLIKCRYPLEQLLADVEL